RRHTTFSRDWSSDVCSSDLPDQSMVLPVSPRPPGTTLTQLVSEPPKNAVVNAVRALGLSHNDTDQVSSVIRFSPSETPVAPSRRSEERRVGDGGRTERSEIH